MSLMLKLLSLFLLTSSLSIASSNDELVEFVKKQLSKNPAVTLDDVSVRSSMPLEDHEAWKVYIMDIRGNVKQKNGVKEFATHDILFSSKGLIAPDLVDVKTGGSLKSTIAPPFDPKFYKKENLIAGNENAKYKLAIFSDPLCPYCIQFVPGLIRDVKKNPKKYALYYYHYPLTRIHPAAPALVKCMSAAIEKGVKDVVLRTYEAKFDARQTNEKKTLNAFNKVLGTSLTMKDIKKASISNHISYDKTIASYMLVNSTPSLFFDGKKDPYRTKYKNAK